MIAVAAYWFYGRPARKLIVVGVTGTKGKSTTCRLIASVLEAAGHSVGLLSTVEFQIASRRWLNDKKMTMLGLGQIQKMLKEMVAAGCQYAVVETSSEGILQFRHYGLHYDVAVFTNLGSEHSERHGGFNALRRDKGKMFQAVSKRPIKKLNGRLVPKTIIVNADDPEAGFFMHFTAGQKLAFTLHSKALSGVDTILNGVIIRSDQHGSVCKINGEEFKLNIVGEFNVANALAAAAVGISQKISMTTIRSGLENVAVVPGRMEFIDEGQSFKVVVDYAHEPLSLAALFKALRNIVVPDGRVIAVIGSDGGGRDQGKRVKMGEISGTLADLVIITDVNCFDEDPRSIAEMLAKGARQAGKQDGRDLYIQVDRRTAIEQAIRLAKSGDIVAITAKGTEPCMVGANGKKIPWDDRAITKKILKTI